MARADSAAASIFSCPIRANSRWSLAFGTGPATAMRPVRWPMTSAEAIIISQVFNATSVQTENGLAHNNGVLFFSMIPSSLCSGFAARQLFIGKYRFFLELAFTLPPADDEDHQGDHRDLQELPGRCDVPYSLPRRRLLTLYPKAAYYEPLHPTGNSPLAARRWSTTHGHDLLHFRPRSDIKRPPPQRGRPFETQVAISCPYCASTFFHDLSGSKAVMATASCAVSGPRSFS